MQRTRAVSHSPVLLAKRRDLAHGRLRARPIGRTALSPQTMDAIRIRGARPLHGTMRVSGAKNAALPILCATLLSDGESRLRNVPGLRDIDTTCQLLRVLGREVSLDI